MQNEALYYGAFYNKRHVKPCEKRLDHHGKHVDRLLESPLDGLAGHWVAEITVRGVVYVPTFFVGSFLANVHVALVHAVQVGSLHWDAQHGTTNAALKLIQW